MVSETITSKSYVLGVQKDSLSKDIYSVFYNIISNNVSDPNTTISRSKFIFPAEPDGDVTNSNYYPIIVIDSPDNKWDDLTNYKRDSTIDLVIDIYSTSMSELDDLQQEVKNALENNWKTLKELKLDNVNIENTGTDHLMRDKIKVHVKTIEVSCGFIFKRS